MARFDARLVQTLLGALAIICGGVVLGISAHVEHSTRTLGVKTSTYTFAAFVGAFTILAQVVMIIARYAAPKKAVSYVATELGISALQWIFWLATTIDVTKLTSEDRSVCRNLNDIFSDPVFNGFDPAAIDVVKRIFKEACRELKAELAFLWIGLITVTISVIYMLVIAFQIKRRNTTTLKAAMTTPLSQHDHTFDPFRDPEGSAPRASVGVAQDPNEAIYKP